MIKWATTKLPVIRISIWLDQPRKLKCALQVSMASHDRFGMASRTQTRQLHGQVKATVLTHDPPFRRGIAPI
jgi:hypothetical protein